MHFFNDLQIVRRFGAKMRKEHASLYEYLSKRTSVSEDDFMKYCHFFEVKKLKRGEFLNHQGETCTHNYFVNKGCLRLFSYNEEGREMTRYFAFEQKFGTSLASLINREPSNEFIQAVEKSEVLQISRESFYHLVETVPEINLIYRDILEMAYTTTMKRIYNFQGKSALERLQWLMAYQPKILARLPNKMIASYLGITPYTLSRLKSEL
jgi:CRP-like cAMP-binding protein